jgi:formylglycine-generating enzyme required for sulfatase activity
MQFILKCFIFLTLLPALGLASSNTQGPSIQCQKIFKNPSNPTKITNIQAFGQAMTEGMLLNPHQSDLFEVYRKMFFGDPTVYIDHKNLNTVNMHLKKYPEIDKKPWREYEIKSLEKNYDTTESLSKYIKSQIQTAGQMRGNLFQIEANLGYWKKLLAYTDPQVPEGLDRDHQKKFLKSAHLRFEVYLNQIFSESNRNLIADLKDHTENYQKKTKALFKTLQQLERLFKEKGSPTQFIRQAMVDLVHYTGYGNPVTLSLLKSRNALDKIEGLKKILDERDAVAIELGYEGHFQQLQNSLQIDFPTGFSKNQKPIDDIVQLEKEVWAGEATDLAVETIRVRSLSLQEAPFRGCLGGSDCSTRSYFSKALDPIFIYFTMTNKDHHSSGQATLVLGLGQSKNLGKSIKVAFLDKLQNIPNQKIPYFLKAISLSLSEKGFYLGIPEDVGGHNGLSNMETTAQYISSEILPKLSHKVSTFTPQRSGYPFENLYSRAYDLLNLKIYEDIFPVNQTEVSPGKQYEASYAENDLDKNKLIMDLLNLRHSIVPIDIIKYISSGPLVIQLKEFKLFSLEDFEGDLKGYIQQKDLSFKIRKSAAFEMLLIDMENQKFDFYKVKQVYKEFLDYEITQIIAEIKQWSHSSDKRKRAFSEKIYQKWNQAILNSDVTILEKLIEFKFLDVNVKNKSGFSVLQVAAQAEQRKVIDWIIQNSEFNFGLKNNFGFNEIDQLRQIGKYDLAQEIENLQTQETDVNKKGFKNNSIEGSPIVQFVTVSPGTFSMGEVDKLTVTLNHSFEMMSIETTQSTWREIIEISESYLPKPIELGKDPSRFKGDWNPVERVSYVDVLFWISQLNELSQKGNIEIQKKLSLFFPGHRKGMIYRLPTEAEWEFVARMRGLVTSNYAIPNALNNLGEYSWYANNSNFQTQPVGMKLPLILEGKPIYDLQGNVFEWVSDWYAPLQGGVDPHGPERGNFKVLRGGCWKDTGMFLSVNYRYYDDPKMGYSHVGFRLVRTQP